MNRNTIATFIALILMVVIGMPKASEQPTAHEAKRKIHRTSIKKNGRRLKFNFAGAKYVAVKRRVRKPHIPISKSFNTEAAAIPAGQLVTIDSSGALSQAISGGTLKIEHALVAPNGRIFIVTYDDIQVGAVDHCNFFFVDPETNLAKCVQKQILPEWPFQYDYGIPAVQFDQNNNLYYQVFSSNCDVDGDEENNYQLRRFDGKNSVSLFEGCRRTNLLQDWAVLANGTVIGQVTHWEPIKPHYSFDTPTWFVRILSDGSTKNLIDVPAKDELARFVRLFPDGNAYVGYAGSSVHPQGVLKYDPDTDQLQFEKYWTTYVTENGSQAVFPTNEMCNSSTLTGFCAYSGSRITFSYAGKDGTLYALAGFAWFGGTVMQYFPEVKPVQTQIKLVQALTGTAGKLVIAGSTSNSNLSNNAIVLHDLSTHEEKVLFTPPQNGYLGVGQLLVPEDGIVSIYVVYDEQHSARGTIDVNAGTISLKELSYELDDVHELN